MEQEVILRVTDLARGGAGVSRDEKGRVVFIPYSAPGDLVRVRILESEKRYARAEILDILEPSSLRQVPPCPIFGRCGGCDWQHLPYSLQWETKTKGVLQALSRVRVPIPQVFEQIFAERIWEYRNRVQLRGDSRGLGFYRNGSHDMIFAERCEIARPEINRSWEETRKEGTRLGKPYKVEVEVTDSGEIRRTWNSAHAASGFRQVHDEQNEKLKNWIYNALHESEVLYDLFGGSGNLSLPLYDKMKEIHCIDVTAPKTRVRGAPVHVHFHRNSAVSWLCEKANMHSKGPKVNRRGAAIIDPPRGGLGNHFSEIAGALEFLGINQIVAVGCDADSWCRDVSRWHERGWTLKRIMAIDLFPQTHHIEVVGLLDL